MSVKEEKKKGNIRSTPSRILTRASWTEKTLHDTRAQKAQFVIVFCIVF